MATDERGRTVFIAGATAYLGWFLTRKLYAEGWRVIAAAKDESERDAYCRLEAMDLTTRFFDSVLGDGSFSIFEGGRTRINPIHGWP